MTISNKMLLTLLAFVAGVALFGVASLVVASSESAAELIAAFVDGLPARS